MPSPTATDPSWFNRYPPETSPLIRLRDLTIRYPGQQRACIQHLSVDFPENRTTLLLGPSGSGKSTLAHALAGLIPSTIFAHTEGCIILGDIDLLSLPAGNAANQVGLLFQDPETSFATLSVEDEIAFGLENLRIPREKMPEMIQSALSQVGMSGFVSRRLNTLSGGESQRVALAALLAMKQPVLILDEPTANLDPAATREFYETLSHFCRIHTILIIEHKLDACIHLADHLVLLTNTGDLLATGPPQEVFLQYKQQILDAGNWIPESQDKRASTRPAVQVHDTQPGSQKAVEIVDLCFAYSQKSLILNHIDLEITPGEFLALLGPNGSGKTTFARLMMGLLPQSDPESVLIFGERLDEMSFGQRAVRIGYVFQNPEHQFVTDTVWEELAYSLKVRSWSSADISARVEALLQRLGLSGLQNQNPFTLSQGQKRRLSVGTMLAAGQQILILDEPTFGQDRKTAYALMDLLQELNQQGITIMMITHDIRLVREYARQIVVLVDGKITFRGSPPELFQQEQLMRTARLI